jgi:hypothetical protein
MVGTIANYIAVACGLAALGYLVWLAVHPDKERHQETDDRAFFDEHGRWPDEPEEAAIPRASGRSYADVDVLPKRRED